jgi:hypothetical protein
MVDQQLKNIWNFNDDIYCCLCWSNFREMKFRIEKENRGKNRIVIHPQGAKINLYNRWLLSMQVTTCNYSSHLVQTKLTSLN